jgi:hypothetical protein
VLIDLRPNDGIYIVDPGNRTIGTANADFYSLPGYVYSPEVNPPLAQFEDEVQAIT